MRECLICKKVYGDHVERCDRDRSPIKISLPGTPIIDNRYRLEERIGVGSLAVVYRAHTIADNTPVIIKMITPEVLNADASILSILYEEMNDCKQNPHPNIAAVYDFGQCDGGCFYIAMEYLQGCTLQMVIDTEPVIDIDRVLRLMCQISEAVNSVHKRGHFHWDLKPKNIFIIYDDDGNEQIKVSDFGLARIKTLQFCSSMSGARSQSVHDLPYYLSPEQCDGAEIDIRSEVYALGIIFYQMLTGKVPFVGHSYVNILQQHLTNTPAPPRTLRDDIPAAIEAIVMRAISKLPNERFQSPAGLVTLLKMAMLSPRQTATVPTGPPRATDNLLIVPTGDLKKAQPEAPSQPLPPQPQPPAQPLAQTPSQPLAPEPEAPPKYTFEIKQKSEAKAEAPAPPIPAPQPPPQPKPSGLPAAPPPFMVSGPKTNDSSGFIERKQKITNDSLENLAGLAELLSESLRASKHLTREDLNPTRLAAQIAGQFEDKQVWQEGEVYVPNLIKVSVPHTTPEKLKEIESIFNSIIFVGNVYKFARHLGFKLLNLIKVEIVLVPPQPGGCSISINWPNATDTSNGLERVVQIKQEHIVSAEMPAVQIPKVAILQPINSAAYQESFLITRATTYIGRFANVFNHQTGELIRRNDLAFLQPSSNESPNNSISRQHAKIEFLNGNFYLFDTGSTNGTVINRRQGSRVQIPLEPNSAEGVLLLNRDIIQLGLALLSFEVVSPEQVDALVEQIDTDRYLKNNTPGSTADIFRTEFITTSLTNAIVW